MKNKQNNNIYAILICFNAFFSENAIHINKAIKNSCKIPVWSGKHSGKTFWLRNSVSFCSLMCVSYLRVAAHRKKSAPRRSYVNTHVGRCRPTSLKGVKLGHSASASGLEISPVHTPGERAPERLTLMRLKCAWHVRERDFIPRWTVTKTRNEDTLSAFTVTIQIEDSMEILIKNSTSLLYF